MKKAILIGTILVSGLCGIGSAFAGGGGAAADRLRDPNGRGMGMSVRDYNQAMKKKRSQQGTPSGQWTTPGQPNTR